MRTIKASEFKARCLALMDEVAASGKPLLVTKNGKPVAELRPHRSASLDRFAVWKGKVRIKGDIIAPLDEEWEAMK